jgi:hypothetical protein
VTHRPFKDSLSLRLALSLTLPRTSNSLAHSTKGTPSPCHSEEGLSGLRLLVSTRFQVLFHSPLGVLFTFPSRYLCTIGHLGVFSLGGWSPQIPTGFLVSRSTRVVTNGVRRGFAVRGFYPLWPAVPSRSATSRICNSAAHRQLRDRDSHNPSCSNACRLDTYMGLGCSPFARHY